MSEGGPEKNSEKKDPFAKKEDLFKPTGELKDGYDVAAALANALADAKKRNGEYVGRGRSRRLLLWNVDKQGWDEDTDRFCVVLSVAPEGVEVQQRGIWEYHARYDGTLLPGTPIARQSLRYTLPQAKGNGRLFLAVAAVVAFAVLGGGGARAALGRWPWEAGPPGAVLPTPRPVPTPAPTRNPNPTRTPVPVPTTTPVLGTSTPAINSEAASLAQAVIALGYNVRYVERSYGQFWGSSSEWNYVIVGIQTEEIPQSGNYSISIASPVLDKLIPLMQNHYADAEVWHVVMFRDTAGRIAMCTRSIPKFNIGGCNGFESAPAFFYDGQSPNWHS